MRAATDEIFIDIETIPVHNDVILNALKQEIASGVDAEVAAVKAPSNYKDEAKINDYIENAKRLLIQESSLKVADGIAQTSLDGAYGEVWCFGSAVNDGEPEVSSRDGDFSALGEREALLLAFHRISKRCSGQNAKLVIGHNVVGFDLRFIWQRCMVLGIRPPTWLPRDPKPWDREVFDTMVAWAGVRDRVKLSKLCRAFGIEETDTIDGSQVWACIQRGEYERVAKHCAIDIAKTRAIYRRMNFEE